MTKKTISLSAVISLFIVSVGYGQHTGLNGRVIDKDSKPVQGALVKLIKADTSKTTDQDGRFSIVIPQTDVLQTSPVSEMITFNKGILSFNSIENQRQIHIEVFDTKGRRISSILKNMTGKQTFKCNILPDVLPASMYFVKIRVGNRSGILRTMNLKSGIWSLSGQEISIKKSPSDQFAQLSQYVDTLAVSKNGYQTTKQAIRSYTAQLPDIVLQSNPANDEGLPPVQNGQTASTTRYWDCCKPHCGWHSNMKMCDKDGNVQSKKGQASGCEGGPEFQCFDFAPIEINSKVSYGWAAWNNHGGTDCGDCYQLDFQGELSGKQMIVQIINIGDGGRNSFDILIPGGGVGMMTRGCAAQFNNAPMGVTYGGFRGTCGPNKDCIRKMCQAAFGSKADMMRGCEWYLEWFKMGDNPQVRYAKVPCPQKIKDVSQIGK